jgi:hypothetical protein
MPFATEMSSRRRDCDPGDIAHPGEVAERATVGEPGVAPRRPGTAACGPPEVAP